MLCRLYVNIFLNYYVLFVYGVLKKHTKDSTEYAYQNFFFFLTLGKDFLKFGVLGKRGSSFYCDFLTGKAAQAE